MFVQMFCKEISLIFTAQANAPDLVKNLTDLETQSECVDTAVNGALEKIKELAGKHPGQNENLLNYLKKIYNTIRKTKDKFERNYLARNLGYLSKNKDICSMLKSFQFMVDLKNEMNSFKAELEEQTQAVSLGVTASTVFDEEECVEIKENFENVKKQMVKFFNAVLTGYEALSAKVSNLDVDD